MRTDFNYSEQDRVIFNFMTTVNKCDIFNNRLLVVQPLALREFCVTTAVPQFVG